MAKKMCKTCGKTPAGTPDETCQKCYRAEHGVSYWSVKHPPSAKKDTAPAPKKEAIIKVPAQVVKKAVAEIPEEAFGKANGKPHTRITFVSVDVYGPSPIAELLRMFEAFNAR